MERTLTLNDLKHYLQEVNHLEQKARKNPFSVDEPGKSVVKNLLNYSSALNVLKTKTAGIIFQLAN
ncbi:MAG: hypothetical protein K0B08_06015 [Bacteroidales bacterium]|nr:hypothetical protein [Bacteroidales bacterium]